MIILAAIYWLTEKEEAFPLGEFYIANENKAFEKYLLP